MNDKIAKYELLLKQMAEFNDLEIPNSGKICSILSLLKDSLDLFWIGLYMKTNENTLGLGIYQGLPACTLIPYGKGVCGTAAATAQVQIVDDVTTFPGYIACHAEAASEIVLPGFKQGNVSFVLDVDSKEIAAFNNTDALYLGKVVNILETLLLEP